MISIKTIFIILLLTVSGQAATIVVPDGGNFQAALDSSKYGDTIILQANSRYPTPCGQCSFVLRYKGAGTETPADWITITTSTPTALPAGTVGISDAANMPKIVALGGRGAIQADVNAKWYKFVGIDFTNQSDGSASGHVQDLLGTVDSSYSHISKPAHFWLDHCYLHPQEDGLPATDPSYNFRSVSHAIALNVADLRVTNSRISGFFGAYRHDHSIAIDSEGIAYSLGPGPLVVDNNFIDAWYAGILTGGSDTGTDNFGVIATSTSASSFSITLSSGSLPVPGDMLAVGNTGKEYSACQVATVSGSDITCEGPLVWNGQANAGGADGMVTAPTPIVGASVRWRGYYQDGLTITRNTFNIDPTFAQYWRTHNGSNPKGYIEFKNGINILFEGNIMQGWPASVGFGLQNQSGSAPWSAIRNVVLRNNLFKRFSYAFGPMSLTGYSRLTERGGNITIENNLMYGNGGVSDVNGNESAFFTVGGGGMDGPLTVINNTVIDTSGGFTIQVPFGPGITGTATYKNNIFYGKTYGHQCLGGDGHAQNCYTTMTSDHNLIINSGNRDLGEIDGYWWPNSLYEPTSATVGFTDVASNNYRLLTTSKYYKKGTDGKDIGVDIDRLMAALSAPPVPTPTPSPTPVPSPEPSPSPSPSPTPIRITKDWSWPSGQVARRALLATVAAQGWEQCFVTGSYLYCSKAN